MVTKIRVELAREFKGESVVLLAMDSSGVTALRKLLEAAGNKGRATAALNDEAVSLVALVRDGPNTIGLHETEIVWCLPAKKLSEVIQKIRAMEATSGPCHHYLDLSSPAGILVLSKEEYL